MSYCCVFVWHCRHHPIWIVPDLRNGTIVSVFSVNFGKFYSLSTIVIMVWSTYFFAQNHQCRNEVNNRLNNFIIGKYASIACNENCEWTEHGWIIYTEPSSIVWLSYVWRSLIPFGPPDIMLKSTFSTFTAQQNPGQSTPTGANPYNTPRFSAL